MAQAEAYRKAKAVADEERVELFGLVRAADAAGLRQVDIVRATGWTREYVAGIVSGKRGATA